MARAIRSTNSRVDLIVLIVASLLALVARGLPPNLRDPVASSMRRTFLAPLVMLQERSEASRRSLLLDNERTAIRDSVALRAMTVNALESENDRLRQLIGLGSRMRWGFIPAEAIHGRGVRDVTTMTLTAGSNAGVRRLSPVVSPEGVVGMVSNVDPTMSEAMIWTHPDFRVSAMSSDGTAFGIVQAHAASATTGYLMELRGIPFRSQLKPGALVVSSGLGGVWPRGIPIGTVLQEISTVESWARTYLLKPVVSPADVGAVMILRNDRVTKGFENVWSSVAAAEAAAQRIVVAGDSAARSAALAEAAARRAALDTMRRDSTVGGPPSVPGGLPPELMPDTVTRAPVAPPTDSAAAAAAAARREAARRAAARRDSARRDSAARRDSTAPRSPTRGF
ncbi:MAG TPA: rod shape-determining protein MreC [Gemmatimonadaceae bacterium]|nr:rod shape-determining protein MreC [Gemmatimonadaceae bacterium]